MSSLLQSTRNTRALPTGTMRYIRSDFPECLTDREIKWLLDNNITTIVDLRSDEEVIKNPCVLKDLDGFGYFHLPVTGGGDTQNRSNICIQYIGRWWTRKWRKSLIRL
ncbi:MAG: tyrosine-protein phosphatase [Oscillospiraceae bacterium]|nr:tyrosine-protein phosphatase [Oscillospiraceae bacterium]